MRMDKAVSRCASIVNNSLKKFFPEDFDRRCLFSAFGMQRLLSNMGYNCIVIGGEFAGLSVARNNSVMILESSGVTGTDFPHYWCQIDDHIVDLGPMYLSVKCQFPAVRAPLIMWPIEEELPAGLLYQPKVRYASDTAVTLPPDLAELMEEFLAECERRFSRLKGQPPALSWVATGRKSINAAVRAGDLWAIGTRRYAGR